MNSNINKTIAGGIIPYDVLVKGHACNTGKQEFTTLFPHGFSVGSQHDSDRGNNSVTNYGTIDLIRTVASYAHFSRIPMHVYVRIWQQYERVSKMRWSYITGWRSWFFSEAKLLLRIRKNEKYRRVCYLALREIVRIFNEENIPKG